MYYTEKSIFYSIIYILVYRLHADCKLKEPIDGDLKNLSNIEFQLKPNTSRTKENPRNEDALKQSKKI